MYSFARNIVIGWFNWLFKRPNNRTLARRKICATCNYNNNGFCTACGCVIKAKTACKECECIKGKW